MNAVEREAARTTAMLLATRRYAKIYSEAPEQHAQLINAQAKLQVVLTKFFKSMAAKANDFINWDHYNHQAKLDYNVDVIINDDQIDQFDGLFMDVTYKSVNDMIGSGAAAAEAIYNKNVSPKSTATAINDLTTEHVAQLVGKKVINKGQPNEQIIDNPNAAYNVTDTVRNDIAEAIKTSLAEGETTEEATARMQEIIDDPSRAEMIANTEAVNAYNAGVSEYGDQSGATGKQWEDAGANDEICLGNVADDVIPIDESFSSGDDSPPGHPNCLCALRLDYSDGSSSDGSGDNSDDSGDG